jgi:hypothetical protein
METYIVKKKNDKLFLFKEEQEIGQISPEAKWVKEGDEFVEDEIFLSKYGSNWDNKKPLSQKYTAFIKGSCGHFH